MNDRFNVASAAVPNRTQLNGTLSPEVLKLFDNISRASNTAAPNPDGTKSLYIDGNNNKKFDSPRETSIIINDENDAMTRDKIHVLLGQDSNMPTINFDRSTGQFTKTNPASGEETPLNRNDIQKLNQYVARERLGTLFPLPTNLSKVSIPFEQKQSRNQEPQEPQAPIAPPRNIEANNPVIAPQRGRSASVMQADTLDVESQNIVKSVLGRFGIKPKPEDMTYDTQSSWNSLSEVERRQIGLAGRLSGAAGLNSATGQIKAYIFTDTIYENARDMGVSNERMKRYVAIQEAGAKPLVEKIRLPRPMTELITENMAAQIDPEIAYSHALGYAGQIAKGNQEYFGYSRLVEVALQTTGEVLKKNNIGSGSASDRARMVQNMLLQHAQEQVSMGNSSSFGIQQTFMNKLAGMSGGRISGEQLNAQLANAYAKGLNAKARP